MNKIIAFLLVFYFSLTARAQSTYYVNDLSQVGDVYTSAIGNNGNLGTAASPFKTLQKALDVAGDNDTIYIDVGLYNQGGFASSDPDKNMTITENGLVIIGAGSDLSVYQNPGGTSNWIKIDADNVTLIGLAATEYVGTSGQGKALTILTGSTGIILDGILLTGNQAPGESALQIDGNTSVIIRNSAFTCNLLGASYGGGVSIGNWNYTIGTPVNNVTVDFENCSIASNTRSDWYGAGVAIYGDATVDVSFTDCSFSESSAKAGGAIHLAGGANVNLFNSCFYDNLSTQTFGSDPGGAAININNGNVNASNCTFTNNTAAAGEGGAIFVSALGTLVLDSCDFAGNASSRGTGLDIFSRGTVTLLDNNINSIEVNSGSFTLSYSGTPTSVVGLVTYIDNNAPRVAAATNCPLPVGVCIAPPPCVNPTPAGDASQEFCTLDNPTIANLNATTAGTLVWYDAATNGTAYTDLTNSLVDGQTYYAIDETVGCDASSSFQVIVNIDDPGNAGTAGNLTVCQGTAPTDAELFTALNGTPTAGGTWTNVGLTYTYTVTAVSPCTGIATADVVVTEEAQPNAGTVGTLAVCQGTTPTDTELFAALNGTPTAGGTWTNVGLTYTYTVTAVSPCAGIATADIVVTEEAQPNAGTVGTLTVCQGTTPTDAELFTALNGTPTAGGTWTNVGLTYTYTVTAVSPCTGIATADVVVTEEAQPNAGTAGTLAVCQGTAPSDVELFTALNGTPTAGGTWTNSGSIYTYTVTAVSPCTGIATADIVVTEEAQPNAGTAGTLAVCQGTAPTDAELFAALNGTPTLGGTWTNSGLTYTYTVSATLPCTTPSASEVVITESDTLAPTGSGAQSFCFDAVPLVSDISITANGVQWYSDVTNITLLNSSDLLIDGNTYYATQTSIFDGCESSTSFPIVISLSDPLLDTTNHIMTESSCLNSNGSLTGLSVTGGEPNYAWQWSNSSGVVSTNQDLTNAPAGSYTVVVTDAIGCQDSVQALIISDNGVPIIDVSASTIISETCENNNGIITDIFVSGGNGNLTYEWSNGSSVVSTELLLSSIPSGNYTLTVTDASGCASIAGPFAVSDLSGPSINLSNLAVQNASCNESNGSITGVLVIGGNGDLSYTWSNGGTTLDMNNLSAGNYSLTITDTNNCIVMLDTSLISDPVPTVVAENDFATTEHATSVVIVIDTNDVGDATTIQVVSGPDSGTASVDLSGNLTYIPDDGFSGIDSLVYTICDEFCIVACDNATVYIAVEDIVPIHIPNGFSPNTDGFNDVFVIEGLDQYPDNEIIIFNRWGDEVFSAAPYLNDWVGTTTNGKLKITGDQVTEGTYYYILDLHVEEIIPFNGFVELRRN